MNKLERRKRVIMCCLGFIGITGIHKFYEKKFLLGFIYLGICGLFGIGTIHDLTVYFNLKKNYGRALIVCIWLLYAMCISMFTYALYSSDICIVRTADVLNGFKTDKIGTYGYIDIKKENISKKRMAEIYNTYIKNRDYNWFTICFEDGTGIIFSACTPYGVYGVLDEDRCVPKEKLTYMPVYDNSGDKLISFEEYKDDN